MRLALSNSWTAVEHASIAEMHWLDAYLSIEQDVFRPGQWGASQKYSLYDATKQRFPTGLAFGVEKSARENGLTVDVVDLRVAPVKPDYTADTSWLHYYQEEALDEICDRTRGVIKAPTGAGKGEMAVAISHRLPCNWLFVCHRADVIKEIAARYLERTNDSPGAWEGRLKSTRSNFYLSTFQSMYRSIKKDVPGIWDFIDKMGGIIVDECHAQPAETFFKVTMEMDSAYYRVGLSGTPLDRGKYDSLRLLGAVGPVIYSISTKRLLAEGKISKPIIRMIPCHQSLEGSSWREVYNEGVIYSEPRNELLAMIATAAQKPCLLFVDETNQMDQLMPRLAAHGLIAEGAHGGHFMDERKKKMNRLVEGEIEVLVCTSIFQEGVNMPELASVVMGAGKASTVAVLQRLGRGMRRTANKKEFEVWDILDAGQRWLHEHAKTRREAYEKPGHKVNIGWHVQEELSLGDEP